MDAGQWKDRTEGETTTLTAALSRYVAEVSPHKAASSAASDERKAHQLCQRHISAYALARIGGREVAAYIYARERDGVSGNTIRLEMALLSHVYTVARSHWGMDYLINPVPLAKTAMPKATRGRERRLQGNEEERLSEAAKPPIDSIIRFALATAMRQGEIAALCWHHVNLTGRRLTLPADVTKTREARTVPLSPAALNVLQSLPRNLSGSVFGLNQSGISTGWQRARARAGIIGLTFHDLRHEAISRLFENTDLDAMEIRAISGHKSMQMLARYTHLRTDRLADRLAGQSRT